MSSSKKKPHGYLHQISHKRIDPPPLDGQTPLPRLIEEVFLSYNAGRLREACKLYASKMLADDTTVGLSLSGALTPAGLGISCLVPLIEAGFIDWMVSTGANLYHDAHFALGMDLHQARPGLDDLKLREEQVIRIYDIVFDYENLLGTDRFFRTLCRGRGVSKDDGHRRVSLPGRQVRGGPRGGSRPERTQRSGGGVSPCGADLHLLARR